MKARPPARWRWGLFSPKEAHAHGTIHADSDIVDPAIHGNNTDGGWGVLGESDRGIGVEGFSNTFVGVAGHSNGSFGVRGQSFGAGGTGVAGLSDSGTGVEGSSTSGTCVEGSSTSGTGVIAISSSGDALDVRGAARFSTAGSGTIGAGEDRAFVGTDGVTAQSHITAVLTGDPGSALSGVPAVIHWVERLTRIPPPGQNGFVLHLTRRVGPATPFTYLIVEPG